MKNLIFENKQIEETLIRDIPFLNDIPVEAKDLLVSRSQSVKFSPKQIIYYQEDPNNNFYIILKGQAKISKYNAEGKEITVEILGKGDMFGYASLIENKCSESTVTTLTSSIMLILNGRDFLSLLSDFPTVIHFILKNACLRLRNAYQHIENISSTNVQKRVIRILLELGRQEGEYEGRKLVYNTKLTHQELANLAGTSRETVTRILTFLKKNGYITVARSRITILAEDKMEDILSK
ncbi:MAG: Crp/Fnr family transcriptional regulator [Candidatus Eremiobacteraeota bacterium]|nr:Crp/Fnr family transcriptional regulator [Candidatus Eremiobacteraeota bacterium]